MGAGGRATHFGLKPGALAQSLARNAAPSGVLAAMAAVEARADLLAKLGTFAAGGPNEFTHDEEQALFAADLAFEHDQPRRCIILTHAGWKLAGKAGA